MSQNRIEDKPIAQIVDVGELAIHITALLPEIKSGALRLWGDSFGRPGEDALTLVACDAAGRCLRLYFTNDETLAVWNPCDVQIDPDQFRIGSADELRFTYYSGQPRTPENIRYRDYALRNGLVIFRTNEDRVPGSGSLPDSTASSSPAVEIAG